MKQKLTLTLFLALLLNTSFGQTKLIAHKSHSGNSSNFKTSLSHNLFDMKASNFGNIPQRYVTNSRLDTLIFLSKKEAVMITSKCTRDRFEDTSSVWTPGRETVYNHPLFSKQHSLDSIKKVLKTQYYFQNNTDSVVFIGYDNQKVEQEKKIQENSTLLIKRFNQPNGNQPLLPTISLIGILALISFFAGFIFFKLKQFSFKL